MAQHRSIAPGVAFKPNGERCHDWVVISEPVNGEVLAVNITDSKHYPDSPCLLRKGSESWVSKHSVAYYPKAKTFLVAKLAQELSRGVLCTQFPDVSPDTLERLILGAIRCDDMTASLKIKFGLGTSRRPM